MLNKMLADSIVSDSVKVNISGGVGANNGRTEATGCGGDEPAKDGGGETAGEVNLSSISHSCLIFT